MNRELMHEVFNMYEDEFNISSFITYDKEPLLQLLIIYKHKLGINFKFNDEPLSIVATYDPELWPSCNAMIISGHYAEKNTNAVFDELTSGFINHSVDISDDDEKYCVYFDQEHAIVNIDKKNEMNTNNIYGYGTRQMFMSLITRLLPWHFKDLTEEQMNVVREMAVMVIKDDGLAELEEKFEEVMHENGVIMQLQRVKLEKIGERILQNRKQNIEDELHYKQSELSQMDAQILSLNDQIRELKIQLFAIENSQDDFDNPISEMIQFIDQSPLDIVLQDVVGERIQLRYKLKLAEYSTKADYEASIKYATSSSMFIRPFIDKYDMDDIKAAYKRIMEDRDCKVWVAGLIDINMHRYHVHVNSDIDVNHCMRHPHLNGDLSCFGTAHDMIAGYLRRGRLLEAMNAITFAAQQCTIPDSYAMSNLITGTRNRKCIECPDGKFRNFEELIEAIREEEI